MAGKLIKIVEDYFAALRDIRRLGAGTPERSYYPAFANLLDAIGADLKGQVLCLSDLGNTGAGHPDFGLYAKSQLQRGEPRKGQKPERGVIEMKPVEGDAWLTAQAKQVSGYFEAYRLVIVTNLRDFLIIGEGPDGRAEKRESFRLAKDAASFWELVLTPRKSAERAGRAFGEYLMRALTQSVALREPKDLAWFLASYARDALDRVEAKRELPGLASIKTALEDALGMKFEGEKGEHFFRSTLVQTLFYGVFSSWVLWAQQRPPPQGRFEWQKAIWHLNVPFVSALYQQLAAPNQLQPLGLVELLDWTEATLNRVVKEDFLAKFNDADAVQFFYEPFLEAFDPDLRKELGVWYTPSEVVTYMVARVDKALKDDLGVVDGLAADNVYVLDPCCGTGAFLTAVRSVAGSVLQSGRATVMPWACCSWPTTGHTRSESERKTWPRDWRPISGPASTTFRFLRNAPASPEPFSRPCYPRLFPRSRASTSLPGTERPNGPLTWAGTSTTCSRSARASGAWYSAMSLAWAPKRRR